MDSPSFHHFGLALKEFSDVLKLYKTMGYSCTKPIIDLVQNAELILCTSNKYPTMELVKPINDQSPISNILKKNNEIIYHTCYEVDNVEIAREYFPSNNIICVTRPKPANLFSGRLVAFYYLKNVGLIELLQRDLGKTESG